MGTVTSLHLTNIFDSRPSVTNSKLSGEQLKSLLVKLHELFESLDATLRREEQNARVRIVTTNSQITPEILQEETEGSEHHAAVRSLATGIAEWLTDYLE